MALVKEFMGSSLADKSSFISSSSNVLLGRYSTRKLNQFSSVNYPIVVPLEKRRANLRRVGGSKIVAAISEDLVRAVRREKAVQFKVRAVLTVRNKHKEDFKDQIVKQLDAITDQIGRNVVLELYSTEVDPRTRGTKKSKQAVVKDWSKKSNIKSERVNYTVEFLVDSEFGNPGAITVINKHQKEFFLESITIEGFACGPVHFPCNSWVQSTRDHPSKRIFFCNQVNFLPIYIVCITHNQKVSVKFRTLVNLCCYYSIIYMVLDRTKSNKLCML